MTFYEKLVELCKKNNTSPTAVAISIGLNKSSATGWKKGFKPTDVNLAKIADRLNVSVEYFAEKKENAQPELSEVDKQLFDIIKDLSDEDKLMMLDMIKTIKEHRKD